MQAKLETSCTLRAIARSVQRSALTINGELKRCGWLCPDNGPPVRLRTDGINGFWCEAARKRALQL